MTTTIYHPSRPSLLDLHPVEGFLALLLITATALYRLLSDPPHLLKRPEVQALPPADPAAPLSVNTDRSAPIRRASQSLAAAGLTVVQLRTMARERGIRRIHGINVRSARRDYLLEALGM